MRNKRINELGLPCKKCCYIKAEIVDTVPTFNWKPINRVRTELNCMKCHAPLSWITCDECEGNGEISVDTEEDRYCSWCGRQLRPLSQYIECPECKGLGQIMEHHVCNPMNLFGSEGESSDEFKLNPLDLSTLRNTQRALTPDPLLFESELTSTDEQMKPQESLVSSSSAKRSRFSILVGFVIILAVLWYMGFFT